MLLPVCQCEHCKWRPVYFMVLKCRLCLSEDVNLLQCNHNLHAFLFFYLFKPAFIHISCAFFFWNAATYQMHTENMHFAFHLTNINYTDTKTREKKKETTDRKKENNCNSNSIYFMRLPVSIGICYWYISRIKRKKYEFRTQKIIGEFKIYEKKNMEKVSSMFLSIFFFFEA